MYPRRHADDPKPRAPVLPDIPESVYSDSLWPTLQQAVEVMLHPENTTVRLSMESLMRAIYNACTCGYAERLRDDLLGFIQQHARDCGGSTATGCSRAGEMKVALIAALPTVRMVFNHLDIEYADGELLQQMTEMVRDGLAASTAESGVNKRRSMIAPEDAPEAAASSSALSALGAAMEGAEPPKRLRIEDGKLCSCSLFAERP